VLFNAKSAILKLYHGENKLIFNEMKMRPAVYYNNTLSWIFIVLAHWNNSLWIDISPQSDTLSWSVPISVCFFRLIWGSTCGTIMYGCAAGFKQHMQLLLTHSYIRLKSPQNKQNNRISIVDYTQQIMCRLLFTHRNRIGGVMVIVLTSSAVNRGFEPNH
jgi:hypothetical protein